jgi:hypothetical protein
LPAINPLAFFCRHKTSKQTSKQTKKKSNMIMKLFSTISFTLLSLVMMASANVFAQPSATGGVGIWVVVNLPPVLNVTDDNATEIQVPMDAMLTIEDYLNVAAVEYDKEVQESFASEVERFGLLEGGGSTRRLRGTEDFLRNFMRRLPGCGGTCPQCTAAWGSKVLCQLHCDNGPCGRRFLDTESNTTTVPVPVDTAANPLANQTCLPVRQSKVQEDIEAANIDFAAGFSPEEAEPQFLFCVQN